MKTSRPVQQRLELAIYDGHHDACVAIADENRVLISLEAERILRRKHAGFANHDEFEQVVAAALKAIGGSMASVAVVYLSAWRHLFADATSLTVLGSDYPVIEIRHHAAHVASALPILGGEPGFVLCADGGSEDGFSRLYQVNEGSFELVADFDDRICSGLFYGTIAQLVIDPDFGRAHNEAPGKLMALSALGSYRPDLADKIVDRQSEICRHYPGGVDHLRRGFSLSGDYVSPQNDRTRCDLARTAQDVWIADLCDALAPYGDIELPIVLTGGCALNVVANSRVAESGMFRDVRVPPVANDSGQALGALLSRSPQLECVYPYLGRGRMLSAPIESAELLAEDLAAGLVVGWYEGRSEAGPRALGHRSYLASPVDPGLKLRLSEWVKRRESYRPLAPIVREVDASRWFTGPARSPFMTFGYFVRPSLADMIPGALHVDGSARVQTLERDMSPAIYETLGQMAGSGLPPVILNTSMNGPGEPLIDTPAEAVDCCQRNGADVLYINGRRRGFH